MNVLWISHFVPYPPKGGVVQRSYNLIKEVSKRHKVYLLAYNHENRLDVKEAIARLKEFCEAVQAIDSPLSKSEKYGMALSSLLSLKPYTARWLQNTKFRILIGDFVKKFDIEIVHFDSIDVAGYLNEIGNLPKVLNHHNIESQMMFRRSSKERHLLRKAYFLVEGIKLRKYEKTICPLFDYNLTVSELDKERLLRILGKVRVEAIPNGVDLTYFKPTDNRAERRSLIFAGGMEWYPNREAMLFFCKKIWPLLKKRFPEVKMTIIGRSPPSTITKLSGEDPNLIVTGFVEDVRPYIDKAEVYVCPIRDGGGTKLKVLDALAMGKPMVAHPVAVEGIDVEREKHFLMARTPLEFVDQIMRLFEDRYLSKKLSLEGRKLVVEKYNFDKIGEQLSEIYGRFGK